MICVDARLEQLTKPIIKGSESFRLEYDPATPDKALWNDIVSYLGEYRFQVQKYNYKLFYSHAEDGLHIRGEEKGKSLLEIGRKGIEDRQRRGEVTKKVVADYLGMQKMEALVANAKDGDTIMYASPADPEEGYTYGFFYIGHVVQGPNQDKHLDMTAIRLDKYQDLDRYNTAIKLLTGKNPNATTVNQFIAEPQIVDRMVSSVEIDFVMKGVFDFATDKHKQGQFASIIQAMTPYIQEFITMIKSGTSSAVLETAFYALENYALALQQAPQQDSQITTRRTSDRVAYQTPPSSLAMLAQTHGYEPPKVRGTCGSSSKKDKFGRSADVFGAGSLFGTGITKNYVEELLETDDEEKEGFLCPNCNIGWVKGNQCPHCKITAEEWAEKNPDKACV